MDKDNTIGSKIRILRKSQKISQEELALKCGLNRNSIYKYEKGDTVPKMQQILSIASALNVNVNDLIGSTPNYKLDWFISDMQKITSEHDDKEIYDILEYTKELVKEGINKHILKDISEYLKLFHNSLIGYYTHPFDNGLVDLEKELKKISHEAWKVNHKDEILSLLKIIEYNGIGAIDQLQENMIYSYYCECNEIPDIIKPIIDNHKSLTNTHTLKVGD